MMAGKPIDIPFIESFNGICRDECLNKNGFLSLLKGKYIRQMKSNSNTIIGAVIGDVIGSVFEWHNIKTSNQGLHYFNFQL